MKAPEQELLREGAVLVTTRRFVVSQTTYAVPGITSVEVAPVLPPRSPNGAAMITLGIAFLLLIPMFFVMPGAGGLLPFVVAPAGSCILLGLWQRKHWARALRYVVRLRTAAGELRVYESDDGQHIWRVVDAVKLAILVCKSAQTAPEPEPTRHPIGTTKTQDTA